jgi:hypothetical protein
MTIDRTDDGRRHNEDLIDHDTLRSAFEDIGGLVITHSEIDSEFSTFLGMMFAGRAEIGLLETVFRTFETSRKIEIFRAFVKSPQGQEIRSFGLALSKRLERVCARRNIICHGIPWHSGGRMGLRLDSAPKFLHPDRERYVVYFDELPADLLYARKVLATVQTLCDAYRTDSALPAGGD